MGWCPVCQISLSYAWRGNVSNRSSTSFSSKRRICHPLNYLEKRLCRESCYETNRTKHLYYCDLDFYVWYFMGIYSGPIVFIFTIKHTNGCERGSQKLFYLGYPHLHEVFLWYRGKIQASAAYYLRLFLGRAKTYKGDKA